MLKQYLHLTFKRNSYLLSTFFALFTTELHERSLIESREVVSKCKPANFGQNGFRCVTSLPMDYFTKQRKIFEISFPFGIEFDIVGTMQLGIKVEPLLRVCGIAHYTS